MHFHGTEVRQRALALLRGGAKNADVARKLNVPAGTISHWKYEDRAKRGECPSRPKHGCPRCGDGELDEAAYAYLLGLYLGDGHVSQPRQHRAPSLRITLDDSWPGVQDEAEASMRLVFPGNAISRARKPGCHDIKVYSKHLPCLFPQHGPGRKHERHIALQGWQQEIVRGHPWAFIRGLIHSDGCRITNWTEKIIGGRMKRYEYPRYFFTNTSADIIGLFTAALDRVGVEWKGANQSRTAQNISVARKASVALMDLHVGPKS
ncbi:helix-turn-helix domain-containing protein [Streptomyces sp. NPDC014870]|uniref:helix-turn-helix domain-containing protein n=1 Tax=Streptomyces sp. NPDC014870 TaxID=3364925 RepID=UPI0036FB4932